MEMEAKGWMKANLCKNGIKATLWKIRIRNIYKGLRGQYKWFKLMKIDFKSKGVTMSLFIRNMKHYSHNMAKMRFEVPKLDIMILNVI